ncbi:MAG: hypothetical protein ACPLIG_07505 [Candidatus Bathyarchaeales archaeon]
MAAENEVYLFHEAEAEVLSLTKELNGVAVADDQAARSVARILGITKEINVINPFPEEAVENYHTMLRKTFTDKKMKNRRRQKTEPINPF